MGYFAMTTTPDLSGRREDIMRHREVREEDIPLICGFPATPEELFHCFPRARFPLTEAALRESVAARSDSTVVEHSGLVVGFANFYRWKEGVCAIGNVMTASHARGLGVAGFLLRHMMHLGFEKHQAHTITVSCFHSNVAGLLLYPKLGFRPFDLEERKNHTGERVALIHMRMERQDG